MTPNETVARVLRQRRRLLDLTHAQIGVMMTEAGVAWGPQTAGFVERRDRRVTVDELVALASCLGLSVAEMLNSDSLVAR